MTLRLAWALCAFAVLSLAPASALPSSIIYVDANATGTPDGTSWPTAFTSLQAGLAAATFGDAIYVAQGVYRPGSIPTDTFNLKNGVHLKGGFAGVTETNPNDHDPDEYPTILSGDIDDNDTECAQNDSGNSNHVVTAGNVNANTILEGFVITRGNAGGGTGGGLIITSVGAELQVAGCLFQCNRAANGGAVDHGGSQTEYLGCIFENNIATSVGGGLATWGGDLTMTNCVFTENTAVTGGAIDILEAESVAITGSSFQENSASLYAGAILNTNSFDTVIVGCDFTENLAANSAGALFQYGGDELRLTMSSFAGCHASVHGGGALIFNCDSIVRGCNFANNTCLNESDSGDGGGLFMSKAELVLIDSRFIENEANIGGGLYANTHSQPLTVVNSVFLRNQATGVGGGIACPIEYFSFVNSLIAGNIATVGGGIWMSTNSLAPDSEITNCTIADNTGTGDGRGVWIQFGDAIVSNSILWGNGTTSANQIADSGSSATFVVTYSDVQGGVLSGGGHSNNISTDPWFVDPGNDNYRIRLCSVCLDACDYDTIDDDVHDVDGDPANNGDATPDLDLHVRAVDRPNIADTGAGTFTFTDMGAFENCIGDANGDQKINGLDIQPFVNCLLDNPAESDVCDCADSTLDGELTLDDVPCFVSVLLGVTDGCYTCAEGGLERGIADCNENEVPDANDIAEGTSQDCNGNFIPDECDIAAETSVDVDENGVPDECQADCNGNDVPDEKDIADEESLDCNENGIPDECERDCNSNGVPDDCDLDPEDPDGDEWVSADCNTNGVPDECEDDCNENGVPDDCDVDPEDPDGDEWVSPDCNENGYPDECDLTLPPGLGSYDCNENEIPDECDIVDETSCDANANDVPDECDILLEECVDANEDECCDEEESLMGGGESMMSSSSEGPCAELTEAECWAVFHDWAMQQCWGPQCEATGFEQFQAARAKLAELGLPFGNPGS